MSDDKKFHVARHDERELFDRNAINRLLDNQYVAHVGFIDQDNGLPFVIPMGFARDNDRILLHGSTGSRMMRQIAQGIDLCVTVTQLNAIVVARSSFNSSMNYESVMVFGVARVLEDSEKDIALAVKAATGVELDRHRIKTNGHIKSLGRHVVKISLASNVSANVAVEVVPA